MRDLILRDYQIEPVDFIMKTKRTVLAICPNGGKTEISIEVIEKYLKKYPKHKILVLTHSTNVLLDNYFNRLEDINVGFTYSRNYDPNVSVHISLPHNEKSFLDRYDFIIIDEAHENYLADRHQGILNKMKPTKELLLTGTPSKFIKEGTFDIYPLACNEISDKWFAKLDIELVASNYKWMGYYNQDGEVKKEFRFNVDDTRKTLENVINALIGRIQRGFTQKQHNHPNWVTKFKTWAFTYNHIGKTLISCKSISQSYDVYQILKEKGVSVTLSNSENDFDSLQIEKFKNNEFDVLVVVNRARLGYSDDDLINIIDMTGTHNPDVIFQMFCRALRGGPTAQKLYIKVTPKELHNMGLTHLSVCAALMLTDRKFLIKYNGSNFNDIEIPTLIKPKIAGKPSTSGNPSNKLPKTPKGNINILPQYTYDVIDTMKNVLCDLDKTTTIYKWTTMRDVKETLGYSRNKRVNFTWEQLVKSCAGNLYLQE